MSVYGGDNSSSPRSPTHSATPPDHVTRNGVGAGETSPTSASSGRRRSPEKEAGQEVEGEEEEEEEAESPPPLLTPVIEGGGKRGNQEEEEKKGEEEGEKGENRRDKGGQQMEENVDAPVKLETEGEGGAMRPRSATISHTEGKHLDTVADCKGAGTSSSSHTNSSRSSSNSSSGESGVGEVDQRAKECSQHPPSSSHSDYHTPSPIPEEEMQRLSLAGAAEGGREGGGGGGGGGEATSAVVEGRGVDEEEEEELMGVEGAGESHRSSSERSAVSRPRAPRPGFTENGYAEGVSTGSGVNSMEEGEEEDGEGEEGSLVSPEEPPSVVVPTRFGNALHTFGGEESTRVKPTARHAGEWVLFIPSIFSLALYIQYIFISAS